jgi:hypothetical protein
VLRPINWESPAHILEKIIAYEAVHAIDSWDDLRRGWSRRTGAVSPSSTPPCPTSR